MGAGSALSDAARLQAARPKAAMLATVRIKCSLPHRLSPVLICTVQESQVASSYNPRRWAVGSIADVLSPTCSSRTKKRFGW